MKRKLFIIGVLFTQFISAQLYTPAGIVNQSSTPTSNNVGIGISDPQSKLTIYEGGGVGSNNFELRTNHLRNPDRYFMKNIIFGTGTEDITFSLRHDGQMFVNGNVGVKTSTPKATLDIENRFLISEGAPVSGAAIRSYDTYWARGYGFVDTSVSNNIGQFGAVGPKDNIDYFYVGKDYTNNIVSFYAADKKSIFYGNTAVYGKLEAKEVKVTLTPTADFVFDENYNLPKLEDIEKHIKDKKHLPEIASAKEMEKEGVNVGEFQIKLLQKIEELTLYTIEQNKQLKKQAEEIEKLKKNIKK